MDDDALIGSVRIATVRQEPPEKNREGGCHGVGDARMVAWRSAATGGKECRRGLLRLERKPKLLGEAAGIPIFLAMGTPYDAIALLDELERRVRKLAADIGSSPGQIMIQAIEEYVADMEDGQIAETRLKALDAGDSSTVSLETLLAEYGMAN